MRVLEEETKWIPGLSLEEVETRLRSDWYNELPSAKKKTIFSFVRDVVQEPMFLLLLACGILYLCLGDLQEAIMLLGFVFVIMGITIYQESKTEKALQALKELSSPHALVIRWSLQQHVLSRDLVKDDIIILNEGDKIPADCVLIWSRNICVDESLLTGESVPVKKLVNETPDYTSFRPGGDNLPFLFSGSLVVQGQAVARVLCTGVSTEIGRIGKALESVESEDTLLQKETSRIVKIVFIAAVICCLAVFGFYTATRGDWVHGLLSGLTLAMGILPEEFPVVLTVFLALGARRLSKHHVLSRKMAAVESLGATTVLCSDKTGTITQNTMTVKKLFCRGKFFDLADAEERMIPEDFHELIEYGLLASKKHSFDPMEKALEHIQHKIDDSHVHQLPLIQEYPISKHILALSHVRKGEGDSCAIVASKGAPEAIIDLCHLNHEEKKAIEQQIQHMAKEGLRILGVAKANVCGPLPEDQHDFPFTFLGLIGWIDPIRPSVPKAIQECISAGIKVVMITGDYPLTAQHIGNQIWLLHTENIITGEELKSLSDDELSERLKTANIIARVLPEEKLHIVNLLKRNGHFVAITGDGVNDAPALKSAHIGVAMGQRGTDVAREASALVLLDDDFGSIVHGIRRGRAIFDNIRKAMVYIISVHVPIAGIGLLPVALGWPIILFPVHVVFLELLIDPACSIIFEAETAEADTMRRPPRKSTEPLFNKRTLILSVLQGVFSLLTVIVVFKTMLAWGQSETAARTATFVALIISNISLILVNRSFSKSMFAMFKVYNPALLPVVAAALGFLGLVIYVPFLQGIFHFAALSPMMLGFAILAGVSSVLWFEGVKMWGKVMR